MCAAPLGSGAFRASVGGQAGAFGLAAGGATSPARGTLAVSFHGGIGGEHFRHLRLHEIHDGIDGFRQLGATTDRHQLDLHYLRTKN